MHHPRRTHTTARAAATLTAAALLLLPPALSAAAPPRPAPRQEPADTAALPHPPAAGPRAPEPPGADEELPPGLATSRLNAALAKAAARTPARRSPTPPRAEPTDTAAARPRYGRGLAGPASAPELGGYIIATYKHSTQAGQGGGPGFGARLLRVYLSGTVLRDFYYRVQMELNGATHLKDMYAEWRRWPELHVRLGQGKRSFSLENYMSPWDVGAGDYSQLVKKLAGFSDRAWAEHGGSNGGRDIGLLLSGDLLPVGRGPARWRLLHYELSLSNGQGINTADANPRKDWQAALQLRPLPGLRLAAFGWKGSLTQEQTTVRRDRWALAAEYASRGWTARAEYARSLGHKISERPADTAGGDARHEWQGTGRADAWYATLGAPLTPWLTVWAKYDAYRDQATAATLNTIYSLCPTFQPHRDIMLQLQYNYARDNATEPRRHGHHELWVETYIRF